MKNNINLNENQMDRFAEATTKHNIEKQLKEKYAKILQGNREAKNQKRKLISISTIVKIAAVVVTVMGSMYLIQETFFSPSPQAVAQNFLERTNIASNPDITRKGALTDDTQPLIENNIEDNSTSQILREANDAFVVKNYSLAIGKYKTLEKQDKLSTMDQFYYGISHLRANNFEDAILRFQTIKISEDNPIEEVDWLLALAYVLSHKEEKAVPILEDIISENNYKVNEAKKLINHIK